MKKALDIIKSNKIIVIIFVISILFLISGFLSQKYDNEQKYIKNQTKIFNSANKFCDSLFEHNILKNNIGTTQINTCIKKLEKIDDKQKIKKIKKKCQNAIDYLSLKEIIESYYHNGMVLSSISIENINYLKKLNSQLNQAYQEKIIINIVDIENNYNDIIKVKESIKNLYIDFDKKIVKTNINRNHYNESLNLYNKLKQEDIKQQLKPDLDLALKEIEQKEYNAYIERIKEQERQRELINNSWIKLNIPYISQNENNVLNGCEAASLLMALQYKGYLKDVSLPDYAEKMPKSDNPNMGFYLDIYGKEPTNVSHWIAPEPLKNFGISSSGNVNIINATGYTLDQLGQEIVNNNPVIIYMTSKFKSPTNWNNGAPVNLHVQLLAGYNTITGDVMIIDPWKYQTISSYWSLPKKEAETIYNQVGKRAIIIK